MFRFQVDPEITNKINAFQIIPDSKLKIRARIDTLFDLTADALKNFESPFIQLSYLDRFFIAEDIAESDLILHHTFVIEFTKDDSAIRVLDVRHVSTQSVPKASLMQEFEW